MKQQLKKVAKEIPFVKECVKILRLRRYRRNPIPWTIGYEEHKWSQIEKRLKSPTSVKPFGIGIDERIVEIPWIMEELSKFSYGNFLDAGSSLNHPIILNRLKGKFHIVITTLYPESHCQFKDGISYTYEDMRNLSFKDKYFDVIASISTLEHIGGDNEVYKSITSNHEMEKGNHLNALMQLKRTLKPEGTLFLTIPFGIFKEYKHIRQFNSDMLHEMIAAFQPKSATIRFFKYENGWKESDENSCRNSEFVLPQEIPTKDLAASSRAVALIKMQKS